MESFSQGYPLFARDPNGRYHAVVGWTLLGSPILIPLGVPLSGRNAFRSFIPSEGANYNYTTEPPAWAK